MSSLGFLCCGFYLVHRHRLVPPLRLIGVSAVWAAFLSALPQVGGVEVFEMGSMYLLATTLVLLNLVRLRFIPDDCVAGIAILLSATGVLSLFMFEMAVFFNLGILAVAIVVSESLVFMQSRNEPQFSYRFFWLALFIHLAAVFAELPFLQILTFWFLARFYGQFFASDKQRATSAATRSW